MAYDAEKMRFLYGIPKQALFLYQTPDAKATIKAADYFKPAVEEYGLATGDIINAVTAVDGATPGGVSLAVKVADDGTVTTAAFAAT